MNDTRNQRQTEAILSALLEARGGWVSAWQLFESSNSLAVHSRVADLRKAGHTIQNRVKHENGKCLSEYRLVVTDTGPPMEKKNPPVEAQRGRREGLEIVGSGDHAAFLKQGQLELTVSPPSTRPWPD